MPIFPEARPYNLKRASLPRKIDLTKVKANPNLENKRQITVTWPAQTGAVRYIMYVSPSPYFPKKFREYPKGTISARFDFPILIPDDYLFHFWVSYITPQGTERFIQGDPTNVLIAEPFVATTRVESNIYRDVADDIDAPYRLEEIRRRHLYMIQEDGEDFYLFIRRLHGQPCVSRSVISADGGLGGRIEPMYTPNRSELGQTFDPAKADEFEDEEAKDPGYQHPYRCQQCFGVGTAGGYLPKILIRIRYGEVPKRLLNFKDVGIEFVHNFNSWTIWHPPIKEKDVLVRVKTGERFTVKDIGQSNVTETTLHQAFTAVAEQRPNMIYEISDDRILEAVEAESVFDIARFDWSVWS